MTNRKKKGYRIERKIRVMFESHGWKVIRAGASLGEADLVCIKNGRSILLQVKSTRNKNFYFYEYMKKTLEGLPFYLVVDFGYGKIRILHPKRKICFEDGVALEDFLKNDKTLTF
jgi:Holliday junction resolvase